jgi:FkbM family methyltransferase
MFGFELHRVSKDIEAFSSISYFQFPKDCQVPNLSYFYEFFFGVEPRLLIEIGAFDGISFSNSSGLIEKGWSAILIEPVHEFAAKAKSRYEDRIDVKILECAVSDKEELLEFQVAGPLTSANTLLVDEYSRIAWSAPSIKSTNLKILTSAVTLADLMNNLENQTVDLLIVDVEGFEDKVFATFNQIKILPSMLIVEMTEFHPDFKFSIKIYAGIRDLLENNGYIIVFKDSINTIFVKRELYASKIFVAN